MYDGIKRARGSVQTKSAPLNYSTGEVIIGKSQHMERWMEDNSDIYSKQNTVSASALTAIKCLLTMNVLDAEPMLGELSGGIDNLAAGKALEMMEYPPT